MSTPGTAPKIAELRMEVLHADGSRVFVTYMAEPDDTLKVTVEHVDDHEEPIPPFQADRPVRVQHREQHHRVDIKGVGFYHVEHLVRASARQ